MGAITWGFWALVLYVLAAAVLLTGCADARPSLNTIKASVDSRITYQRYFASDYRYVPEGIKATGNCAVFAQTYCVEARKAGYSAERKIVYARWGEPHAVCVADGWTMDNMKKRVY